MITSGILSRLPDDESTRSWLRHIESIDSISPAIRMPGPDEINDVLIDLAVPHEDIGAIIQHMPTPDRDPDAWWLIERAAASIHACMGEIDGPPPMPALPSDEPLSRYFYVYVFLALKPLVDDWFRQHGVPADIGRRSLADLGRNMAVHRKRHGTGGFNLQNWIQLHFRGAIYQLGRLQFQRARLGGTTGNAITAAGHPFGSGDFVLNVHITDFSGPLRPDLCDASFDLAREFFPRHFPEEPYHLAMCHSWLLDPRLADYLPEGSNIIRFQRRFTLVKRDQEPSDDGAFLFVFGQRATGADIDSLPRNTTIQRALIDHVKAGKHWYGGSGWLLL